MYDQYQRDNEKMAALEQANRTEACARLPEVHEWLGELNLATDQALSAVRELQSRLGAVTRIQPETANKCGEPQKQLVPLADALRNASQRAREIEALAIGVMSRLEV